MEINCQSVVDPHSGLLWWIVCVKQFSVVVMNKLQY